MTKGNFEILVESRVSKFAYVVQTDGIFKGDERFKIFHNGVR